MVSREISEDCSGTELTVFVELGESMVSMSRGLGLSITAVSQSVLRGELLVKQKNLLLVEGGKFKY